MTPEEIIDRAFQPEYALQGDFAYHGQGHQVNPVCGDTCVMYVKVTPERVIEDARHTCEGCTICCAAADLLCEAAKGKAVQMISEINLFSILGIPIGINRRQCVVTPFKALVEALQCSGS